MVASSATLAGPGSLSRLSNRFSVVRLRPLDPQLASKSAIPAKVARTAGTKRAGVERVRERLGGVITEAASDLREAADDLLEGLSGAVDLEPARAYRRAVAGLSSSYDRPTEAQRLDLDRLTEFVSALESETNVFIVGEVSRFRERVLAANLEVFSLPPFVGN